MVEERRGNREIKNPHIKKFVDSLTVKDSPFYATFVSLSKEVIAKAEREREDWIQTYESATEEPDKLHSLLAIMSLTHDIQLAVQQLELYELESKSIIDEETRKNFRNLMTELHEARKAFKPPDKPDPRIVV